MRLGSYECHLAEGSIAREEYGQDVIFERHRHRYEFNSEYEEELGSNHLSFTGRHPESDLVEVVELDDHPWYLAVQFHPEFQSKPMEPHPLFRGFIRAARRYGSEEPEDTETEVEQEEHARDHEHQESQTVEP
jgi:CTP synthase